MPNKDQVIEPIDADFEDVTEKVVGIPRPQPVKTASVAAVQLPLPLPLVEYEFEREVICQRVKDGYVNATAMCKAAGKKFNDYSRLTTTGPFVAELSSVTGIPATELIQSVTGGNPKLQGTWVHPQVAIHLAQWLSPKFAVKVTQWVFDWMSGKVPGGNMPYHLRRYMANLTNVPNGYFSILNEVTLALIAPLEQMGYTLPQSMVPDISLGRMFSGWLRDNGYDPDNMPRYQHHYEDGRVVDARAYPKTLRHKFERYFVEEWMQKKAVGYFKPRDPEALPYIQNLLALPNYSDIAGYIEVEGQ
ncbi:MAG TPA: KilA-N domain-containing protein [Micavibrio sp.]|nr:KilA-N domain-containing protein [Micavibrio sp.]